MMTKRQSLVLLVVLAAALLGAWAALRVLPATPPAQSAAPSIRGATVLPHPRVLPAFALQQSDGTTLTAEELRGRWTVLFLGFTHCPDICPTTLAQLASAQKQWAALPDATRPRVLLVSADPERDSPELLGRYAHGFHPDTLAATAPVPQLEAFVRSLSLVFMKVPGSSGDPADYTVDHSATLVLLDPQARMAGVVQPPFGIQALAEDLAALTQANP